MGISLDVTRDTWGVGSIEWLAERKGFDTCRPGTVDISLFLPAHYTEGFIPSGTILARVVATKLLGPFEALGAGGLEVAVGHMLHDVRVADRYGNPFGRAAVAVLWEGVVLRDKLPVFALVPSGMWDPSVAVDLPHIRYEMYADPNAPVV